MRYLQQACLCGVALLLAGCGLSTPVKLAEMHTYNLSGVKVTAAARRHRTDKTLLVSLPMPDPGFASSKMIYEPIPFNLRSYANHQWAAPPAQMILPMLAQSIINQGYFKAVVTTPFVGLSNYRLDSRLVSFTQDFLRPNSREHVVLQETLTNSTTNEVIASKQFSVYVPALQNNPYSGVVAANRAVDILGNQIAAWTVTAAG